MFSPSPVFSVYPEDVPTASPPRSDTPPDRLSYGRPFAAILLLGGFFGSFDFLSAQSAPTAQVAGVYGLSERLERRWEIEGTLESDEVNRTESGVVVSQDGRAF